MKTESSNQTVEILVVEDSPTQAEQLQYILEQHGYKLVMVRDGRAALAAIEQRIPTLVISDVIMPEMDGYELCSNIKRTEKLRNMPVILLTSLSDPADVVRGLECGADSFIFKPYDESYLLARISYILANLHVRQNDSAQMGVEVFFAGRKFFITSDRLQILNLLLSTYEAAVHKNKELAAAQDNLKHLNDNLEAKIVARTAVIEAEITERKDAQIKLQAQLGRLDLLHRITRAIGERQDLTSIFQIVLRRLHEDLALDFGCVCLYEPTKKILSVTSMSIRNEVLASELALNQQSIIAIDSAGLERCVQGQLIYEPYIGGANFSFSQQLARSGLQSLVMAPLLAENKVFGVLLAARTQANGFNGAECEFLGQLSEHVALAAHQAQLHGNLQQAYDELRQSQQTIMQQERLRAVGQMASGVAHDINNTISPIMLYTESLLEQEVNLSAQARRYLVTIQRAIEDVAQTVSRMREFYRPRESQLALDRVKLNALIEQVVELTRARWSDEPQRHGVVIKVQMQLAAGLPDVLGAANEIRDALTNLIFNAVDAMPENGVLTLRTRVISTEVDGLSSEKFVALEVQDTGIGMDEETKLRCLEPFFTTKGTRGTGLGLAMVYGMAERHDAKMEIDSAPGSGTVIRLIFKSEAPTTEVSVSPAEPLSVQPLRILVIDDDRLVIESMVNILTSDDHLVTAADGGQAGIDTFLAAIADNMPFNLVITDLGMPYIDGRKVAKAIKNAAPTPIILLTGWGERLKDENEVPEHVDYVLNKPPKLSQLRSVLATVASTLSSQ